MAFTKNDTTARYRAALADAEAAAWLDVMTPDRA